MKEFAIAAALLVGCTSITAPGSDRSPKLAQIAAKSRAIAAREQECKDSVEERTNGELPPTEAVANASPDSRMRAASERKQRELAMCKADAERADSELSAQERAQYQSKEQEERDRAALVRTLLTSRPQ